MNSLLSLLFRTATSGANVRSQIGLVTIDCAISETHDRTARVTEFPIEGGAVISDHVVLTPKMLTIEGFITDTPFSASGFSLGTSRASTNYFLLEQMWQARIPFICFTQLAVYTNMVVESLIIPKTREAALRFQCTLRQLTMVTGQNTVIPSDTGSSATPLAPASAAVTGAGGGVGSLVPGNVANPATGALGADMGRQMGIPAPAGAKANASFLYGLIGG